MPQPVLDIGGRDLLPPLNDFLDSTDNVRFVLHHMPFLNGSLDSNRRQNNRDDDDAYDRYGCNSIRCGLRCWRGDTEWLALWNRNRHRYGILGRALFIGALSFVNRDAIRQPIRERGDVLSMSARLIVSDVPCSVACNKALEDTDFRRQSRAGIRPLADEFDPWVGMPRTSR